MPLTKLPKAMFMNLSDSLFSGKNWWNVQDTLPTEITGPCLWHCVKCVQMWSFFWSVFSHIRPEYEVSLRIQSECGKMLTRKTRKNSVFGHFSRSVIWLKNVKAAQWFWILKIYFRVTKQPEFIQCWLK